MARLGAAQRRISLHAFVQMELRFGLITDKVVGDPDEGLGACEPGRVADHPRNLFGLKRHRQQVPIFAGPAIEHVQPCQQPELVGQVIKTFGEQVIPVFDKDPIHRTTRFRTEAAGGIYQDTQLH